MNGIVNFFKELWMTNGPNQGIMNDKRSQFSIVNNIMNDKLSQFSVMNLYSISNIIG